MYACKEKIPGPELRHDSTKNEPALIVPFEIRIELIFVSKSINTRARGRAGSRNAKK